MTQGFLWPAFLVTCFLMWNDQMEAATLREEDKALISRIGGKMGDENMMQVTSTLFGS